jgi:hypothetical protein
VLLKYVPMLTAEERAKLRPVTGDVVLFENTKYVVIEVGMKYVTMYREGGNPNAKHIAKINEVVKYIPIQDTAEEEERFVFEDEK